MSKCPSNSKIRPKEPDSRVGAFSSPSHCLPIAQRREILGQIHGFHKAYFISFLCSVFQGNGVEQMS